MTDAINLSEAQIFNSPADIADWPVTVAITQLGISPATGIRISADVPRTWDFHMPGWGNGKDDDGNVLYTVWAVARINGHWAASGVVQMWKGRPSTGAFETPTWRTEFPKNWAYDGRWGALAGHQPQVGDLFGFFISAGNARGEKGVTSTRERSNVVAINLPANDTGVFPFVTPNVPAPAPAPPVAPPDAPGKPLAPDPTSDPNFALTCRFVEDVQARLARVESTGKTTLAAVRSLAATVKPAAKRKVKR